MDIDQEEALYEFLENTARPFTLEEIASHVQTSGQKRNKRMVWEITSLLNLRRLAFKLDNRRWISRRGYFEQAVFVITPTRQELLNGILVPGHRCVPFANPMALPHKYEFFWKGKPIPVTTTEAPPEDLYPYYCIYGEEFAPQYIAEDNPENEAAFNSDPYEEPGEVSIHTLDMRGIYLESSFVPGDRFVVRITDWKESRFELEKAGKNQWSKDELDSWLDVAEGGFEDSFALLGPGFSTEEQIAYAYWFGGKRMKEIPAYSLEELLYEKTNRIETAPYGIESRFWSVGREIPDFKNLQNNTVLPDRTFIEDILFKKNIPVSEFVILSYIKDAFFRNEKDIDQVISRLIPPAAGLKQMEFDIIADFIADAMEDFYKGYSLFVDRNTGPIRQRLVELHTAVIELSDKQKKGEMESSWLPKHTFIVLSQIQGHAASLLEDLAFDEVLLEPEMTLIDNSVDSMIDTFTDVKELIDNAMDNFRRSNLTVLHGPGTVGQLWQIIQISISGLDVWRRAIISHKCTVEELHFLIQIGMGWKNSYNHRFYRESSDSGRQYLHERMKINDIDFHGKKELTYEYGTKWIVKIMVMSSFEPAIDETMRYVAGEGASPPEMLDGPRQFSKIMAAFENGGNAEKQAALRELGVDFTPDFDMDKCNRNLGAAHLTEKL
ncbi:MAG: plasmid pRiA4b ORF-3 family protein [Treponema sp.]|jgi:hypothetical protein|nr:plasmid pRiA4b ORF-3 family protein [Treponema sp.]